MFKPVTHATSVVDRCVDELRRAILSGALQPGDRLPPERALAEQFQLNRVTVRHALSRLAGAGLVSVRQGSGYRVEPFRRRGGPDLLPGLVALADEQGDPLAVAADLLHVRRALAQVVLERLAARPDVERRGIDSAIEAFAAAVERGADTAAIAAADVAIVAAILAATGSDVFALCLNPILTVVERFGALRQAIYRDPASNLAGWRLLQAWLDARDPAALEQVRAVLEARDADSLRTMSPTP